MFTRQPMIGVTNDERVFYGSLEKTTVCVCVCVCVCMMKKARIYNRTREKKEEMN